jgi:hypothetical protein
MEGVAGNPLDEAMLRSEEMRLVFEASELAEPWMPDYLALVAEGWSWRQAVYMIWASQPQPRTPKTQSELATDVLGLTSDRVIRQWRSDNPAMELRVRRLQVSALGHARADVLQALVQSAKNPSYRHYRDRELYLKMTGDYKPRSELALGVAQPDDLETMSAEELAALAQAPNVGNDDAAGA